MTPAVYDFAAIRAMLTPCDCHIYTNPHGERFRVPPITDCPVHGHVGEVQNGENSDQIRHGWSRTHRTDYRNSDYGRGRGGSDLI